MRNVCMLDVHNLYYLCCNLHRDHMYSRMNTCMSRPYNHAMISRIPIRLLHRSLAWLVLDCMYTL